MIYAEYTAIALFAFLACIFTIGGGNLLSKGIGFLGLIAAAFLAINV